MTTQAYKTNSLPTRLTLLIVSTLTVMAGATIAPSLPAMGEHFKEITNADYLVRLALTLPALFIAFGAPFVGVIIDRLGRKPLLLLALVVYGLAGSSGFFLNDINLILIGRAFLGLSVAGIMTITTTLVGDYYTGTTRAGFMGLQAGFMGLGGVLFLTLGGFLADLNWRSPFLIYLMALVLVPLVFMFLPEPKLQTSSSQNPGNTTETQKLPVKLILITYAIAIVTQIVFYLIPVQLPFHLKELLQANASQSGLAIALATLFSAVASINYRRIKSRLSFNAIYGVSFVNLALGYTIISLAKNYSVVLIGLGIAGVGLGLLMPNMNLCLTTVTPDALRGRILSGITTSFFLGQFVSPFISQPLSKTYGFANTYGIAAMVMALLTAIAVVVVWRYRQPSY